ncbi:hypothetical protein LEMLEM_LOCUS8654 [Lemmus lemmus]
MLSVKTTEENQLPLSEQQSTAIDQYPGRKYRQHDQTKRILGGERQRRSHQQNAEEAR